MGVLIRSVTLIDQQSPFHNKTIHLRIADGLIQQIGFAEPADGDQVFDASGCYLSAGWVDLLSYLVEPGDDGVEDVASLLDTAAAGGYTAVLACSSGMPVTDSRIQVGYLLHRAAGHVTDLLPCGTISRGRSGNELAEIYDMVRAGVRAFSDAPVAVASAGLMLRALVYAKPLPACIMSFPHDNSVSPDGQVHEGALSMQLGLRGLPAVAEEIVVARDLLLAAHAGRPLHFACITTAGAVQLVKQAKQQGIPVTAAVPAMHLLFDESQLQQYDTNWKLFPPLRSRADMLALRQGLADGTLDAVCSLHQPCSYDQKLAPFDQAAYGMTNLQTAFSLLNEAVGDTLSVEQLVDKLAAAPRRILGLDLPQFVPGAPANFTIFDRNRRWIFLPEQNRSQAANSPLLHRELTGKALAVCNHGQFQITP